MHGQQRGAPRGIFASMFGSGHKDMETGENDTEKEVGLFKALITI